MHGNLQERNTVLLEIPLEEKGTLGTLLTWAWPAGSAVNHLRSRPTDPSTRPANGGRRTRPDRRVIRHAASRTGPPTVRPLTSSRRAVTPRRWFTFARIPFFLVPCAARPAAVTRTSRLAGFNRSGDATPRPAHTASLQCSSLVLLQENDFGSWFAGVENSWVYHRTGRHPISYSY